jgi:hypothetical protein
LKIAAGRDPFSDKMVHTFKLARSADCEDQQLNKDLHFHHELNQQRKLQLTPSMHSHINIHLQSRKGTQQSIHYAPTK